MSRSVPGIALLLTLLASVAHAQGGMMPGPGTVHSTGATYPCSLTVGGCGVAYSFNRAMVSTYSGPLFQVSYGVPGAYDGTFDVSAATRYADIATHCQGANANLCSISKRYDHAGGCDLTSDGPTSYPPVDIKATTGMIWHWNPSSGGVPFSYDNNTYHDVYFRYDGALGTTPCAGITATGNADITTFMAGEDGFWDNCCSAFGVEDTNPAVLVVGSGWSLGWRAETRATIDCETDIDYYDFTPTATHLFTSAGVYYGATVKSSFWVNQTKVHDHVAACAYLFSDFSPSGFTGPRLGERGVVGPDAGDNSRYPGAKNFEFAVLNHAASDAEIDAIQANQVAFHGTAAATPTGCTGVLNGFDILPVTDTQVQTAISIVVPAYQAWSFRIVNGYYMGAVVKLRNANTGNSFEVTPAYGECDITAAAQRGNGTTGGPGCTTDNTTTPCYVVSIYSQAIMGGLTATQATAGKQCQLWFSASPNGKTAMKGNGSCSYATPSTSKYGWTSVQQSNLTIVASGERTGNFTGINGLAESGSAAALFLGWDNSANQAYAQPPAFHSGLTCSATDSAWHNFLSTQKEVSGVATSTLYVDSATSCASGNPANGGSALPFHLAGNDASGFNFLTGYWGEVIVIGGGLGGQLSSTILGGIHTDQAAYW